MVVELPWMEFPGLLLYRVGRNEWLFLNEGLVG
jgi:hypothetical protein